MSFKTSRSPASNYDSDTVEVKSKLDAEFRRFALDRRKSTSFDEFYTLLSTLHQLTDQFVILYPDQYDDLLPINNDDNYHKALQSSKPVLRLQLQRKGESYLDNGYAGVTMRKRNPIISKLIAQEPKRLNIRISQPEDFRRVSAIIDVDIVPDTCRRVKLMKNGQDKPLGFYIRDGTSLRATHNGIEKVPGIFISRLVPGGLAESTGLIAVNDEVLEVNGIEVAGKTLDQVTDMMVANSSNLIITVKPVNQRNTLARPARRGSNRDSQLSTLSTGSSRSRTSQDSDDITDHFAKAAEQVDEEAEEDDDEEEDEVCDHLARMSTSQDLATCEENADEEVDSSDYQDAEGDTSGLVEVSANEGIVNHHHHHHHNHHHHQNNHDHHQHQPKPVMSL